MDGLKILVATDRAIYVWSIGTFHAGFSHNTLAVVKKDFYRKSHKR